MSTDLYRRCIDQAFREISPFISRQTGLLHVHEDVPSPASPTKENFLYALLLLRKKTLDAIQEGKDLLGKLLIFQNTDPASDQYGNFPALITNYPVCRNWHLPVFLCLVMAAIRTSFDTVLGEELQQRLHAAHRLLFSCAQRNAAKCRYHAWEKFVIVLQEASDTSSIAEASERFIEERGWLLPDEFGLALAALSNVSGRSPLIEYARRLWHPGAATYIGPAIDVRQRGAGPATTLFDVFMGQNFPLPARSWGCQTSLELALITPREWDWTSCDVSPVEDPEYPMWSVGPIAVAACPKSGPFCFPVRIVTPSCSIAMVFPSGVLRSFSREGSQFIGRVQIAQIKEEDPCLLRAYVERTVPLTVDGKKASVFPPEKGISIGGVLLSLEEKGIHCLGHVALGNRPGQRLKDEAFDWKISLDIVRGTIEDEVRFLISIGG